MNKKFKPEKRNCSQMHEEIKGASKGLCELDWGSRSEYTRLRKLWLKRKKITPREFEEFLNELAEPNREALEYLTRVYN